MMADSGYKLFTDFWNSLDAGNKRPMTFDTFDTFLHSNPVNLHLGYLSGISMAIRAVLGREDLCLADLRDLCPLLSSNCKDWGCYLHTAFEQPLRETDTSSSSRTQDSFISGDLPVERPPTGTDRCVYVGSSVGCNGMAARNDGHRLEFRKTPPPPPGRHRYRFMCRTGVSYRIAVIARYPQDRPDASANTNLADGLTMLYLDCVANITHRWHNPGVAEFMDETRSAVFGLPNLQEFGLNTA